MFISELTQSLDIIPGVGPKTIKLLSNLGIYCIRDLMRFFPRTWEDRTKTFTLKDGITTGIVNGIVQIKGFEFFGRQKRQHLKIRITDDTAEAVLLAFNRPFLSRTLEIGQNMYCYGHFEYAYNELQSSRFELEAEHNAAKSLGKVIPVYPLTAGLSQNQLRQAIAWTIEKHTPGLTDPLPAQIKKEFGIPEISDRYRSIHLAKSMEEALQAQETLAFEDMLYLTIRIIRARALRAKGHLQRKPASRELQKQILQKFAFKLTADQQSALEEINADMQKPLPMSRLLQGEVGSGKTLIAALAIANCLESGGQTAYMAPTELLARQTADTLAGLFDEKSINIVLLTGSVPSVQKNKILQNISDGTASIIVGTHALFSANVSYKALNLIIIDEQHRFGVNQRSQLCQKAGNPDFLMMTATPIPRSLMLTAFSDLDISTLKTMPQGRKPVITHLAVMGREQKVYDFVKKELNAGHQAYFVYPVIDDNVNKKSVIQMHQQLSGEIFKNYKTALIHSRLEEEEKSEIMSRFRKGEIDILVSTTVIEVGVNVANASCMVIEHAELFGLSALHQLRGRVGRSDDQAWTFLVYSPDLSEDAKARLKLLLTENDGFVISEKDLLLRGPGELTGSRQSGYLSKGVLELLKNPDLLSKIKDSAQNLLKKDQALLSIEHELLKQWLNQLDLDETDRF